MVKKKKKQELEVVTLYKLDLGCGLHREDGFLGVDIIPGPVVDVVCDLEKYPWPWADDSVEAVSIKHYIEHVKDLIPFMNELYRVMRVGAKCFISAPYYTSIRSMQDPTHVRPICENTFLYYNKGWRKQAAIEHYPITADFDFSYGYLLQPNWASRSEEARLFAIAHYNNVVLDLQVTLIKRSPE